MNYTVELLKKDLHGFRKDANILIDGETVKGLQNLDNGDLYISTSKKIGECKKCGHAVYIRKYLKGDAEYIAYCPQCNIIKTEFQIIKK